VTTASSDCGKTWAWWPHANRAGDLVAPLVFALGPLPSRARDDVLDWRERRIWTARRYHLSAPPPQPVPASGSKAATRVDESRPMTNGVTICYRCAEQ
jgi:hypothetical protein